MYGESGSLRRRGGSLREHNGRHGVDTDPLLDDKRPSRSGSLKERTTAAISVWTNLKPIVWPYIKTLKYRIAVSLVLLVVSRYLSVSSPFVFGRLIDTVRAEQLNGDGRNVLYLVLLYGVCRIGTTVTQEVRDTLFVGVTDDATSFLQASVFERLLELPVNFHTGKQTGALCKDIDRGIRASMSLVHTFMSFLLPTVVEVLMVLYVLIAKYDIYFASITGGCVICYAAYTHLTVQRRKEARKTIRAHEGNASNCFVDALLNFEAVKYFNNEDFELDRYRKHLDLWKRANITHRRSLALLHGIQSSMISIGATVVVGLAARSVLLKRNNLSVGDVVLIHSYLLQVYRPVARLAGMYREVTTSIEEAGKTMRLFDYPITIRDAPDAQDLPEGALTVQFNNVKFGYREDREVLHGISFEATAGTTTALVGSTGSGKTSITRLLYRLYDVNEGSVCINGINVRQLKQRSLRAAIAIVPQDVCLFNDTIYNNISYGKPGASEDEIIEAAATAGLASFIELLPEKYNTFVGERGLKLSGGERQRLGIARCLLKNARILILDEATSAVDTTTELSIKAQLADVINTSKKPITVLAIAHRISTISHADQILVLERGAIEEQGTHEQLLEKSGRYAQLWKALQHGLDSPTSQPDAGKAESTDASDAGCSSVTEGEE